MRGPCRIFEKRADVFVGTPMLLRTSERKIMRMIGTLGIAASVILTCHEGAAATPAGTAIKQAAAAAALVQREQFLPDRIDRARSDADTARQMGQQRYKRSKRKR